MLDLIKRIVAAGLDTQARVMDFLDELVSKGKINETERAELLKKLDEKISHGKDKTEELINEITARVAAKNPFVSKKEMDDIQQRIDKLNKRLAKLEEGRKKRTKTSKPKQAL
jgi:polyhydroxyalkanoate synthesis regulator phasin